MHPVSYLFEDIYRNYWGIAPAAERPAPRRVVRPAAGNRDLLVQPAAAGLMRADSLLARQKLASGSLAYKFRQLIPRYLRRVPFPRLLRA